MRKLVLTTVLVFILISCDEKDKNTEIVFFEGQDVSTTIKLDSTAFLNQSSLRTISVRNDTLIKSFQDNILSSDQQFFDPDIRYMIGNDSLEIFVGYNGYFITSNGNKGHYKSMSDLEKIIQSNLNSSISFRK